MSGPSYQMKKAAAGILFPRRLCAACETVSTEDILCPDCRRRAAVLRWCPICATVIAPTEAAEYRCYNCRHQPPPFRQARAALPYEGILRERLLSFKFNGETGWRRTFGLLLADTAQRCYADLPIDAVVPVPLSSLRWQERGYNQAELCADIFCQELGLPLRPDWLLRPWETPPLWPLSASQRQAALNRAFQAGPVKIGATVLLIDDIYTTGATASAASRALLRAGAEAVYVLTVAGGRESLEPDEQ